MFVLCKFCKFCWGSGRKVLWDSVNILFSSNVQPLVSAFADSCLNLACWFSRFGKSGHLFMLAFVCIWPLPLIHWALLQLLVQNVPGLSCPFPALVLASVICLRSLILFSGGWYLQTRIWTLGVIDSRLIQWPQLYKCIYLPSSVSMSLSISIKLKINHPSIFSLLKPWA